eukprot:IDg4185t1
MSSVGVQTWYGGLRAALPGNCSVAQRNTGPQSEPKQTAKEVPFARQNWRGHADKKSVAAVDRMSAKAMLGLDAILAKGPPKGTPDSTGCAMVSQKQGDWSSVVLCRRTGGYCSCDYGRAECRDVNMRGRNAASACSHVLCVSDGFECVAYGGILSAEILAEYDNLCRARRSEGPAGDWSNTGSSACSSGVCTRPRNNAEEDEPAEPSADPK